jgi:hypothetical protein
MHRIPTPAVFQMNISYGCELSYKRPKGSLGVLRQAGSGQSPLTVISDCPVEAPTATTNKPLVKLVILILVF